MTALKKFKLHNARVIPFHVVGAGTGMALDGRLESRHETRALCGVTS